MFIFIFIFNFDVNINVSFLQTLFPIFPSFVSHLVKTSHFSKTLVSTITCFLCLVTQSCLTLCDPMDCSPPDSSVHGDSPGKNTGVNCHALLQGIFSTQGLNPGQLHCRQILYCLRQQGSPIYYKIQYKIFIIYICTHIHKT